jgi:transposase
MKRPGAKCLVFYVAEITYIQAWKQSAKDLWKRFSGWQELEHNGENFLRNMVNGTAYLVALMLGQKRKFGKNFLSFVRKTLIWSTSIEGLGRSNGGFTSKIHASVDALGNLLKFIITPGQRGDITQAEYLLHNVTNAHVIADKAYDSSALRLMLIQQHCDPVIPSKSNSKNPYKHDEHIYKERHSIECFFSKIKYFRRVFSRFDKSARNFAAFLAFVGACIWLR